MYDKNYNSALTTNRANMKIKCNLQNFVYQKNIVGTIAF